MAPILNLGPISVFLKTTNLINSILKIEYGTMPILMPALGLVSTANLMFLKMAYSTYWKKGSTLKKFDILLSI